MGHGACIFCNGPFIPNPKALLFQERAQPIFTPMYLLGTWLGKGKGKDNFCWPLLWPTWQRSGWSGPRGWWTGWGDPTCPRQGGSVGAPQAPPGSAWRTGRLANKKATKDAALAEALAAEADGGKSDAKSLTLICLLCCESHSSCSFGTNLQDFLFERPSCNAFGGEGGLFIKRKSMRNLRKQSSSSSRLPPFPPALRMSARRGWIWKSKFLLLEPKWLLLHPMLPRPPESSLILCGGAQKKHPMLPTPGFAQRRKHARPFLFWSICPAWSPPSWLSLFRWV